MKEKKTSEVKANVISGMSSSVGAAIGVVVGSAISSEVNAVEIPVVSVEEQEVEVVSSQPVQGNNHASVPAPIPTPEPEPEPESDVEVISYETINADDGTQMDVAVVVANGREMAIVDFNRDGIADAIISDFNRNGQLEEGEIVDVANENIAMRPLQEAANVGNLYAQVDEIDYINDANVGEYTA